MLIKRTVAVLSSLLLTTVPVVVGDEKCQSIYDIACGTDGLENFCGWIQTTALQDIFSSQESLTVFAPINEAITSMEFIADAEKLREVVLFSVHDGAVFTDQMDCETGSNLLRMASGKDSRTICEKLEPVFQKGGGNIDGNKPRIVSSDIEACNGVVHMVDAVMLPGGFQNVVSDSSLISEERSDGSQIQKSSWYAVVALVFFMYQ